MLITAAWTEGEAAERGITVTAAPRSTRRPRSTSGSRAPSGSSSRASDLLQGPHPGPGQAARRPERHAGPDRGLRRRQPAPGPRGAHASASLETRSRARAKQALKAITRGLTWTSAAKRYGRVRARTIVKSPAARPASSSACSRRARPRPPATAPPSSGSRRSRHGAPPRPTSSARRRGRSCPRRRSASAVEALEPELRAKWLPRTTCAPAVATHPDCGNPPTGE